MLFEVPFPWVGRVDFTLTGVVAGGRIGLIVLAGVSLMLVLGLTTPLPRLLSALRWYRVPALLIEIGLLMYRYLFLFAEEATRMRQAQRLRGPQVPWRWAMGGFSNLWGPFCWCGRSSARSACMMPSVFGAQGR